jgi:hypothetical protein
MNTGVIVTPPAIIIFLKCSFIILVFVATT